MNGNNSTPTGYAMTLVLIACFAWGVVRHLDACTTMMVGRRATQNGSVLMASSCDGDVMGLIYVMPAQTYPPDTKLPMYWNLPRPKNYEEYQAKRQERVRPGRLFADDEDLSQHHPGRQRGEHDNRRTERAWREHRHRVLCRCEPAWRATKAWSGPTATTGPLRSLPTGCSGPRRPVRRSGSSAR